MAEDFLNLPNKKGQDETNNTLKQIASALGVTTDALASAVNLANKAGNDANAKIADVESRFQSLTTAQQQASEIIDARKGKASLRAKIDELESRSNQNATDITKRIRNNGDTSVTGVYRVETRRYFNVLYRYMPYEAKWENGIKIKTNIPLDSQYHLLLSMKGRVQYNATQRVIDINLGAWAQPNGISHASYSSSNSFKPEIKMAVENGLVVIMIENVDFKFSTLQIDVQSSGQLISYFQGWDIVADKISADATNLITVGLQI